MEIRIRNAAGVTMLVSTSTAYAQGTDATAESKAVAPATPVVNCASCPGGVVTGHIPPDPYTVGVAIVAFALGVLVGRYLAGRSKAARNG
jgi:hypothetical protein